MGKPKSAKSLNKPTKTVQVSKKKDIQKKSHAVPIAKINRKLIKKKDKKQLKHQKAISGVLQTQMKFVEEKQRKKREKTEIVGDMKPLLDSLPCLDELVTIRDKSKRTGIAAIDKKIRKPKNKREKKNMLIQDKTEKYFNRFDHLQKVWKDPAFKKSPRELIAERIKQKNMMNTN
jgi:hypothetical protein